MWKGLPLSNLVMISSATQRVVLQAVSSRVTQEVAKWVTITSETVAIDTKTSMRVAAAILNAKSATRVPMSNSMLLVGFNLRIQCQDIWRTRHCFMA